MEFKTSHFLQYLIAPQQSIEIMGDRKMHLLPGTILVDPGSYLYLVTGDPHTSTWLLVVPHTSLWLWVDPGSCLCLVIGDPHTSTWLLVILIPLPGYW